MMSELRKILYPLSVLYGKVTKTRNKMFDRGILKSTEFDIPVIVVGNLSVGGTGKTPQIEYLIRLLKDSYSVAVLSRGYKRKTKGFLIADASCDAQKIGDEPFQYYQKFKDIIVAVDADRVNGINQLLALENPPEIVLLDDAYQHRKVNAGFNILLTPYNDLYVDDSMLPSGNLREQIDGAERAQVIIVTKCPSELTESEQYEVAAKLKPTMTQTVFFTTISYDDVVKNKSKETVKVSELKDYQVVLVTGIANPKPMLKHLENHQIKFDHISFPDHHNFTKNDLKSIENRLKSMKSDQKMILTTEKDFVRLKDDLDVYYLEIMTKFIDHASDFDKKIVSYIEQNCQKS